MSVCRRLNKILTILKEHPPNWSLSPSIKVMCLVDVSTILSSCCLQYQSSWCRSLVDLCPCSCLHQSSSECCSFVLLKCLTERMRTFTISCTAGRHSIRPDTRAKQWQSCAIWSHNLKAVLYAKTVWNISAFVLSPNSPFVLDDSGQCKKACSIRLQTFHLTNEANWVAVQFSRMSLYKSALLRPPPSSF